MHFEFILFCYRSGYLLQTHHVLRVLLLVLGGRGGRSRLDRGEGFRTGRGAWGQKNHYFLVMVWGRICLDLIWALRGDGVLIGSCGRENAWSRSDSSCHPRSSCGFKDKKTPLYSIVAGNLVNVVLDPVLMFSLKFGVAGVAIATVVSQYVIASLLLWNLNKRVVLLPNRWGDLAFNRFLTSGGYLLGRTIALLLVFIIGTSMAARQGATAMVAHQICVQIWLAISLLSDSLALALPSIVANTFSKNDYKLVKKEAIRVLRIGCGLRLFATLVAAWGMPPFSRLFTNDDSVLAFVGLLLPFVVLTQPIDALAFVFGGLHSGVSDFENAAI